MTAPIRRHVVAAIALLLVLGSTGAVRARTLARSGLNPVATASTAADTTLCATTGWVERFFYRSWIYYSFLHALAWGYFDSARMARGWLRFDLTAIPETTQFTDAALMVYQYDTVGINTSTVRVAKRDPNNLTPEYFYDSIQGCPVAAASASFPRIGWVTRPLNRAAVAELNASLTRNWYALGVTWDVGGAYARGDTEANAPRMRVLLAPNLPSDVAVISTRLMTYPVLAGETDTLAVTLTNVRDSTVARHFYVASLRDGVPSDSAFVDSVGYHQLVQVLVPVHNPLGATGATEFGGATSVIGDWQNQNDSEWLDACTFPAGTYLLEDFEGSTFPPAGWDTIQNNNGARTWQLSQNTPDRAHFGTGSAFCGREYTHVADDWLLSPLIVPSSAYADTVGFYCHAFWDTTQYSRLEVWALRGHELTDTLRLLRTLQPPRTPYTEYRFSLDEFDGDSVCLGLHWYSGRNADTLYLDDFYFMRLPTGGIEAPAGVSLPVAITVQPNPARAGQAVSLRGLAGSAGVVSVYDATGRFVWSATTPRSSVSDTRPLALPSLATGVYLVRLQSGSATTTTKLVVQH
jgi:hypothetical protein